MDPLCLLGQALECSVCLEQLNSSSRVLPCQHTFCKSCIHDIVSTHKELRCPECRVLVTVPYDELPPNILLLRILEGMKMIPQPPDEPTRIEPCDKFAAFDSFQSATYNSNPSLVSNLTNIGMHTQNMASPNSLSRTIPSSQSIMQSQVLESASKLLPGPSVNLQLCSRPMVTFESSILNPTAGSSTSIHSSLIQTMPAYTQTKPTTSLTRYLFTPPRSSAIFSSPHSMQASLSANLGNLDSTPRLQNVQSLIPGCFPSSVHPLLQTGDSYQVPTMINSILATNLQVVSSPVVMPPIPSVVSPLVSGGPQSVNIGSSNIVSGAVQMISCKSIASILTDSLSFSTVPLFQSNSSIFSTSLSPSSALQTISSTLPFNLSSQSSESDVLAAFPSVSSIAACSQASNYPSIAGEVEQSPSSPLTTPSHPLGRRGQNFENMPKSGASDGVQSMFNSRAEEQFRICSSLIEKGSPMAFPSNTFAKAIFTYNKREPRDLSFSKGDVIQVRKKIDENWYQGELNGHLGFFPASYVKIIEKPPSNVPQCKALYDFKMTSQEEKDCLTFNKGDVITVLRRIDQNWAEGKFQTRIGIFPLSFVDLNPAAKTLIRIGNETSELTSVSRISESDWSNPEISSSSPSTMARVTISTSAAKPLGASSNSPLHHPSLPSFSSRSSPAFKSGAAITTTAPSQAMATNGLQQDASNHQRKRHSFTDASIHSVTCSSPSLSMSNRFSLDITNVSDVNSTSRSSSFSTPKSGPPVVSSKSESAANLQSRQPVTESKKQSSKGSTNSTTLQYFIALYSYRPRKADELELKKGQIYSVSEKCQDGWYKGRCITTDKIGVFPGNYVSFATLQTLAAYRAKLTGTLPSLAHLSNNPVKSGCQRVGSPVSGNSIMGPSRTRSSSVILHQSSSSNASFFSSTCKNLASLPATPPDLPPRHVSSASSGLICSTLKPSTSEGSCPSSIDANADKKSPKEKSHCNGSGGGIGLMRKLAGSKKKCKSPPLLSLDNPVFEESPSKSNTIQTPTNILANIANEKISSSDFGSLKKNMQPLPLARERYRCIVPYPANSIYELELQVGDIIYVHKKRDDGWYKGTLQRTGQTGLFPASFVECC